MPLALSPELESNVIPDGREYRELSLTEQAFITRIFSNCDEISYVAILAQALYVRTNGQLDPDIINAIGEYGLHTMSVTERSIEVTTNANTN